MIPNSFLRLVAVALCAASAVSLGACASDGDGGSSGGGGRSSSDAQGALLADAVRIASIDRNAVNTEGRVRYVVDNVSGADQEDLTWSVSFLFPPRQVESDISVAEESETTSERSLVMLRGDAGKVLDATCAAFNERRAAGQAVIGTRLRVAKNEPAFPMARSAGSPGTRFLNKLEMVAVSNIEDASDPTELVLEFENISGSKASELEVQAVFPRSGMRTKWRALPAAGAGQRTRAVLDLRGVNIGDRQFLVKVRQQDL
ncbi:MAG: hypothetical protein K8T90_03450 [Planctomycetes bacterium]|nr:hypothetical protein [Planctomycetota bacterium]